MQPQFWHDRWQAGKIGFHQIKVNSRLIRLCDKLALHDGDAVFVPLCGKSHDLVWLANCGYRVLGVEISEIACRDFFVENNFEFDEESADRFTKFCGAGEAQNIQLWCGDFFALTREDLQGVAGVYDRAALIALPPAMRVDYAAHLTAILPGDARILLISMEYDETKMKGPPFSVDEEGVRGLFAEAFDVEVVAQSCGPDIVGNLKERGLDSLEEKVYLMEPRA